MDKEKNPRLAEKTTALVLIVVLLLFLFPLSLILLPSLIFGLAAGGFSGGIDLIGLAPVMLLFLLIIALPVWLVVKLLKKDDKKESKTILSVAWQRRILITIGLIIICLFIIFLVVPLFEMAFSMLRGFSTGVWK